MDIDDIRRSNIRRLEKEFGTTVYKTIGMSPSQFYNLRDGAKDSKTGKSRGMRKETARKIEEKTGKPLGWLDIDPNAAEAKQYLIASEISPSLIGKVKWPFTEITPEEWDRIPFITRQMLEKQVKALVPVAETVRSAA